MKVKMGEPTGLGFRHRDFGGRAGCFWIAHSCALTFNTPGAGG